MKAKSKGRATNESAKTAGDVKAPVPTGKLTDPDFVMALYEKAIQHYFMAARYKSGGGRFRKDVTSDRAFRAIKHCQTWYHRIQRYETLCPADLPGGLTEGSEVFAKKTIENLREWARRNYDQRAEDFLAREFSRAAIAGDIDRLNELVKLCQLHKSTALDDLPIENKRYAISWHYYVGVNAVAFLRMGTVPTKKQVREAAIQHRAAEELSRVQPQIKHIELSPKIRELIRTQRPNWTRIFRELNLTDLPSASTRRHL
jgi:hypothetical protein